MIIYHFSLVAFNILSFSLIFVWLITLYFGMFLFGFILPWTLCFLDLVGHFLSHVREVFRYYLFKYFPRSFLSFPSRTPVMWMLVCLKLLQQSLRWSPFLFVLLSIFILGQWFTPFCPPGHLAILLPQLFCCLFLLLHPSIDLFVL